MNDRFEENPKKVQERNNFIKLIYQKLNLKPIVLQLEYIQSAKYEIFSGIGCMTSSSLDEA